MISVVLKSLSYNFFNKYLSTILLCKAFFFLTFISHILDGVTKRMISEYSSPLFLWMLNFLLLPKLVLVSVTNFVFLSCSVAPLWLYCIYWGMVFCPLRTCCLSGRKNFPIGSFLVSLLAT